MSLEFIESFGVDSIANMIKGGRWDARVDSNTALTISTSAGPFGDAKIGINTFNGTLAYLEKTSWPSGHAPFAQTWVGFYMKLNAFNNGNDQCSIIGWKDTGTAQVSLYLPNSNSGFLRISRGLPSGTTLATATQALPLGTWVFIEMFVKFNSSTGQIQLKMNGTDSIALTSSLNTAPSGNNSANTLDIFNFGTNTNNPTMTWDMSSLYVCGPDGSINNGFLGAKRVTVFRPTGNGTVQFTPLAGSNFSEVNANPSTGDSSYNSTSTVGNKDRFTHAAASALTGIAGVQVSAIRRIDNAGPNTDQVLVYDGTTEVDLPSSAPSTPTTYAWNCAVQETVPTGGGTFTNTDITNLQFGYKLTS